MTKSNGVRPLFGFDSKKGSDPFWFFPFLSGVLLFLSFPRFNLGFLAWAGLVPLLVAIEKSKSRFEAAKCGLITGFVFYGVSLHWLTHVAAFGWIFVTCLETIFLVLFSLVVYELRNRGQVKTATAYLSPVFVALAWTSCEFLRSEIPVFGLGWNLLAYSQSDYLWVVQSANTMGAYGLGFVMVFTNVMLHLLSQFRWGQAPKRGLAPLGLILLVFGFLLSHGFYHLRRPTTSPPTLRLSLIQGNIPQSVKWEIVAREKILEIYRNLTQLAAFESTDLVIWPEAAFPGYFNNDVDAWPAAHELARQLQVPLVVGSPHLAAVETAFNSAYLLNPNGEIVGRYDKQYLVPFGEYVPLKSIFGFLEPLAYTLGVSDFSAGHEPTIFKVPNKIASTPLTLALSPTGRGEGEGIANLPFSFSVLICFEDVFPSLARAAVDRGADFLAVITNDAWFGRTGAPYQHLQASIFRAVENGVPVVRAANTGVSAFISSKGEVLDRVQDFKGNDIFITGQKTFALPIEKKLTLYRRGGWTFPYVAVALFVTMLVEMKRLPFFLLPFTVYLFLSGCIRLSGSAGYWKQGAEDEAPKGKAVGFDTADLTDPNRAPGSIEVPAE